ncbi:hypothetical protein TRFO_20267 [Tritrichomonas foetus]|uniref:Uncharacterized protein n=1 Tax=Tritrichomonas foetus TaxID=1144522 RepID=A0A1J4KGC2_9EUKA|nr:hypothetical protein TRFO_20267 [Tritrichomonas foetus]|eukprot:OHT10455.1 hypothetical protein TRFO_20267 [Tritrichomonas foetus]
MNLISHQSKKVISNNHNEHFLFIYGQQLIKMIMLYNHISIQKVKIENLIKFLMPPKKANQPKRASTTRTLQNDETSSNISRKKAPFYPPSLGSPNRTRPNSRWSTRPPANDQPISPRLVDPVGSLYSNHISGFIHLPSSNSTRGTSSRRASMCGSAVSVTSNHSIRSSPGKHKVQNHNHDNSKPRLIESQSDLNNNDYISKTKTGKIESNNPNNKPLNFESAINNDDKFDIKNNLSSANNKSHKSGIISKSGINSKTGNKTSNVTKTSQQRSPKSGISSKEPSNVRVDPLNMKIDISDSKKVEKYHPTLSKTKKNPKTPTNLSQKMPQKTTLEKRSQHLDVVSFEVPDTDLHDIIHAERNKLLSEKEAYLRKIVIERKKKEMEDTTINDNQNQINIFEGTIKNEKGDDKLIPTSSSLNVIYEEGLPDLNDQNVQSEAVYTPNNTNESTIVADVVPIEKNESQNVQSEKQVIYETSPTSHVDVQSETVNQINSINESTVVVDVSPSDNSKGKSIHPYVENSTERTSPTKSEIHVLYEEKPTEKTDQIIQNTNNDQYRQKSETTIVLDVFPKEKSNIQSEKQLICEVSPKLVNYQNSSNMIVMDISPKEKQQLSSNSTNQIYYESRPVSHNDQIIQSEKTSNIENTGICQVVDVSPHSKETVLTIQGSDQHEIIGEIVKNSIEGNLNSIEIYERVVHNNIVNDESVFDIKPKEQRKLSDCCHIESFDLSSIENATLQQPNNNSIVENQTIIEVVPNEPKEMIESYVQSEKFNCYLDTFERKISENEKTVTEIYESPFTEQSSNTERTLLLSCSNQEDIFDNKPISPADKLASKASFNHLDINTIEIELPKKAFKSISNEIAVIESYQLIQTRDESVSTEKINNSLSSQQLVIALSPAKKEEEKNEKELNKSEDIAEKSKVECNVEKCEILSVEPENKYKKLNCSFTYQFYIDNAGNSPLYGEASTSTETPKLSMCRNNETEIESCQEKKPILTMMKDMSITDFAPTQNMKTESSDVNNRSNDTSAQTNAIIDQEINNLRGNFDEVSKLLKMYKDLGIIHFDIPDNLRK